MRHFWACGTTSRRRREAASEVAAWAERTGKITGKVPILGSAGWLMPRAQR